MIIIVALCLLQFTTVILLRIEREIDADIEEVLWYEPLLITDFHYYILVHTYCNSGRKLNRENERITDLDLES